MVHSANVDAQSCVAEHSYQSFGEHEVLDRDSADTGLESPGGERLGGVVRPDHETGHDSVVAATAQASP